MDRRTLLKTVAAGGLIGPLGISSAVHAAVPAGAKRAPRILLRSSWQTVNIGDVAHTPGMCALLEREIPGVEITLWGKDVSNGVAEILKKRFPKLNIISGSYDKNKLVRDAFAYNDLMVHGSGPYLLAAADLDDWRTKTRKPYGVYGITLNGAEDPYGLGPFNRKLLRNASFVFLRDSKSLEFVRKSGFPDAALGQDAAFATDTRNDDAAGSFIRKNGLKDGKFLCVIPKYRITPYWEIRGEQPTTPADVAAAKRNEEMKVADHAPLLAAIRAVLAQTDLKILVCPEDESQVKLGFDLLYKPIVDDPNLDAATKDRLVWRNRFWSLNSALGVYVRSAAMLSNEQHSPIMCIGNGIPAILCRWKEQTTKGFMWQDIGLGEWLFNHDQEGTPDKIVKATLDMVKNLPAARAKAKTAQKFVQARQKETIAILSAAAVR